ncbi:hypothetical protein Zmor_005360 [Zophobas morio]|uniref:Uncharacterized protein n=1 Tax=Zophobas morio TaxID=2755281 RepID=A0AA38IUF9_9CUCU|nr:hypothetical protein Zmor_005360 [Zophobas morio]
MVSSTDTVRNAGFLEVPMYAFQAGEIRGRGEGGEHANVVNKGALHSMGNVELHGEAQRVQNIGKRYDTNMCTLDMEKRQSICQQKSYNTWKRYNM